MRVLHIRSEIPYNMEYKARAGKNIREEVTTAGGGKNSNKQARNNSSKQVSCDPV